MEVPCLLLHEERRGHVLQLLARLLTDLGARAPAVRAGQLGVGQWVLDPLAVQTLGEPLPPLAPPIPLRLRHIRPRWLLRGDPGDVIRRVLGEQPELVRVDAFPPRAELATEQQPELVLQLLDAPLRPLDRLRLLADDLVAKLQVRGKRRLMLTHARIVAAHPRSK